MFSCSITHRSQPMLGAKKSPTSQAFLYRLASDIAKSVPDCLVLFVDEAGSVAFNRIVVESTVLF